MSAAVSQNTAASSHNQFAGGLMNPAGTYDTAVINGGGQGLYNRLLRDSTDNLLRPTV